MQSCEHVSRSYGKRKSFDTSFIQAKLARSRVRRQCRKQLSTRNKWTRQYLSQHHKQKQMRNHFIPKWYLSIKKEPHSSSTYNQIKNHNVLNELIYILYSIHRPEKYISILILQFFNWLGLFFFCNANRLRFITKIVKSEAHCIMALRAKMCTSAYPFGDKKNDDNKWIINT